MHSNGCYAFYDSDWFAAMNRPHNMYQQDALCTCMGIHTITSYPNYSHFV